MLALREIHVGDCRELLRRMPDESVDCVVTSPPYWGLRDYNIEGQRGLEESPTEYVNQLMLDFREVRRVLKKTGTCWVNLGDSYIGSWGAQGRGEAVAGRRANAARQIARAARRRLRTREIGSKTEGLKTKDLVGIPWLVAFALRSDGWWLRAENIWHKANPTPEAVLDRPCRDHEQLFLFTKNGDTPLLWRHEVTRAWRHSKPKPDYVWTNAETNETTNVEPEGWETSEVWRRWNLWAGMGYYYDRRAVMQPATGTAHSRVSVYEGKGPRGVHPKASPLERGVKANPSFHAATTELVEERNLRTVWKIASEPYHGAHFATFPTKLVTPCILAGCPPAGVVLDPFGGSGTVGQVAEALGRDWILLELNPGYAELARKRVAQRGLFVETV